MARYATIDAVLNTLYDCVSGPPGGQDREWVQEIFFPRRMQVRTKIEDNKPDGRCWFIGMFCGDERDGLTLPAAWLSR